MIKRIILILLTVIIMAPAASAATVKIGNPIKVNIKVDTYGEITLDWETKKGATYNIERIDEEGNSAVLTETKKGSFNDIVRHKGTYTYKVTPMCGSMPISIATKKEVKIPESNLDLKVSGRDVEIVGKSTKNADGYEVTANKEKKTITTTRFKSEGNLDTVVQYKIRAYKDKEGKRLYTDSITRYIYISDYSIDKALEYARKYAREYNPDFRDYNPQGGDCANFVSQCLTYGGMEQTDEWNYIFGRGTSAWINVRSMYNYFSDKYEVIHYPTYEDFEPGDIVMKKDLSHVVICSGIKDGKPIICAHNDSHLDEPLYGELSNWLIIKPTCGKAI